ncbi:MAG TPA: cyclase family protein, partial [Novosphingobium sp.]|nr:cyclase family protein [Novosphingobium sp.]
MARKIVDISIFLENDVVSDPPVYRPRIEYIDHRMSVPELAGFFPGLREEDLPDGEACALARIDLITHNGTH